MAGMRRISVSLAPKTVRSIRLFGLLVAQLCAYSMLSALCFACPLYLFDRSGSSTLYGAVAAIAFIPGVLATPVGGDFGGSREASRGSCSSRHCSDGCITAVYPHEAFAASCGCRGSNALRPIWHPIAAETDASN